MTKYPTRPPEPSGLPSRPSGSMCMACYFKERDCSGHRFDTMPAMRVDRDGTVVVRCIGFTPSHAHKDAEEEGRGAR